MTVPGVSILKIDRIFSFLFAPNFLSLTSCPWLPVPHVLLVCYVARRRRSIGIPTCSSHLSCVPPGGSGRPPQMIELIHNYERFALSIYLLRPDEQSITPPPGFSKHHECLMAANLLPTSNLRPAPDTYNTALIYFNTTTSSPRPAAGVYRRNWPFQTEVSNQTRPLACLILNIWKPKLFKTPRLSVWSHATEFSRFFLCFFHIYSFKFVLLCFFSYVEWLSTGREDSRQIWR